MNALPRAILGNETGIQLREARLCFQPITPDQFLLAQPIPTKWRIHPTTGKLAHKEEACTLYDTFGRLK